MIKSISAINKGLVGAIIASSVFIGASSPIKNSKQVIEHQKTELISQEAAKAMKAHLVEQSNQSVPVVHVKALDETFMKFAESEEDKKNINEFLNQTYEQYGTYMASSIIQSIIDYNMFTNVIEGEVHIFDKVKTDNNFKTGGVNHSYKELSTKYSDGLNKLIMNKDKIIANYLNGDVSMLSKKYNGKPPFEISSKVLINMAKENYYNKLQQASGYENSIILRKKRQMLTFNDTVSIERRANLIAYQQHLLDAFYTESFLKDNNIINSKNDPAYAAAMYILDAVMPSL